MRRNPRRRYTGRVEHLLTKPEPLGVWIVMIAQDSRRGPNGQIVKFPRVERRATSAPRSHLCGHLRMFGDVELDAACEGSFDADQASSVCEMGACS